MCIFFFQQDSHFFHLYITSIMSIPLLFDITEHQALFCKNDSLVPHFHTILEVLHKGNLPSNLDTSDIIFSTVQYRAEI